MKSKTVYRAGAAIGEARTLGEVAALLGLEMIGGDRVVEGPDTFEIVDPPVIVKVQVPIGGTRPWDGPALIYDRARAKIAHVPIDDELTRRLAGRPKVFFFARRDVGGWRLGAEAPWQEW